MEIQARGEAPLRGAHFLITRRRSLLWRIRHIVVRLCRGRYGVLYAWKESKLIYKDRIVRVHIDSRSLKEGFTMSLCPDDGWCVDGKSTSLSVDDIVRVTEKVVRYMEGYRMDLYVVVREDCEQSVAAFRRLQEILAKDPDWARPQAGKPQVELRTQTSGFGTEDAEALMAGQDSTTCVRGIRDEQTEE